MVHISGYTSSWGANNVSLVFVSTGSSNCSSPCSFAHNLELVKADLLSELSDFDPKLPSILVKDTRLALGLLSAYVKQKISGLKCAAITGSNGKTTTKELLKQILCEHCEDQNAVLATAGNFNNEIGLPLTLLRLNEANRFAVVELGANHQGEIAYTSQLAKPDVALINNVMPAHLEGFGRLKEWQKQKVKFGKV